MTIALRRVSKRFGELLVVSGVSLDVLNGELFVLLGGSGAGKSTILRLISGLTQPEEGTIEINGRDITNTPPQDRNVGFVFQNYALFRHMNVRENIEYGLRVRGVDKRDRRRKCDEILELVDLSGMGNRFEGQLSGGQRQRVALARALVYEPQVLLLDEPFGALDEKIRSQLRRKLKEIQKQLKISTILVTHDQEEAFELADRIGVLVKGQILEVGKAEDLYRRPKTEYVATFLGGSNVLVGRAEVGKIRLGDKLLPFPEGSPLHDEGSPVRILFRPESVTIEERQIEGGPKGFSIGQGTLIEKTYSGACEKLRFELETLEGVRPLAPAMLYGQRYATIEVLRCAADLQGSCQLIPGNQHWLNIPTFHVLNPSGIKLLVLVDVADLNRLALSVANQIHQASHGPITALMVASEFDNFDEGRNLLRQSCEDIFGANASHLEIKMRKGSLAQELVREAQECFCDLVVINQEGHRGERELSPLCKNLLLTVGVPIIAASGPIRDLKRILVCTAAGEPGKAHISFCSRLARHTKSEVSVLHVFRDQPAEYERNRVENHMKQARDSFAAYGVKCETICLSGDRLERIVEYAEGKNYDMVILGSAGAKDLGVHALDFPSLVVKNTSKSVLIVPYLGS